MRPPERVKQAGQQPAGLGIDHAVDLAGPKMALEGLHDLPRRHRERRGVAVALETLLEIAVERPSAIARPQADARSCQRLPGKAPARIDLALWGDVGMADDVARRDAWVARDDAGAELDQRADLHGRIVVPVAVQVHDLDADRRRVQCLTA